MGYTEAFKEQMVKRMLGPPAVSASALSKQVDVPQQMRQPQVHAELHPQNCRVSRKRVARLMSRQRRHSTLGYVSPVDFELVALPQKSASQPYCPRNRASPQGDRNPNQDALLHVLPCFRSGSSPAPSHS